MKARTSGKIAAGHTLAPAASRGNPDVTDELLDLHSELGIPATYGRGGRPRRYAVAEELVDVGPNPVGRMQRLTPLAAERWAAMCEAAAADGMMLLIVSGFRDPDYQADLIRRKLGQGQAIDDILSVVAPPGYSQHHTGCAVDIATPGFRPLTEEFAQSEAFAWLGRNAEKYGFSMTYPPGNADGFIYEPWNWALNVQLDRAP